MTYGIEHPMVTAIRQYGYPDPEPEPFGDDFFGNEVFPGDTILVLDDEFFLKDELSEDAIAILEHYGAVEKTAK